MRVVELDMLRYIEHAGVNLLFFDRSPDHVVKCVKLSEIGFNQDEITILGDYLRIPMDKIATERKKGVGNTLIFDKSIRIDDITPDLTQLQDKEFIEKRYSTGLSLKRTWDSLKSII